MTRKHIERDSAESRWPVVFAILAVIIVLVALPDRVRLMPPWFMAALGAMATSPLLAVSLAPNKTRWLIVERVVMLSLATILACMTLVSLADLVSVLIRRSREISGLTLLTSSVAIWINNVLMFSLLYWQIDRGGPGLGPRDTSRRPDWLFPQEGAPAEDLPFGWIPAFVDYLYLSFSTATAFSSTDVLPLTHRAKLLMMVESSISLVTLVVVAARAINVLGG
jgi:uncharacterized membrane protein